MHQEESVWHLKHYGMDRWVCIPRGIKDLTLGDVFPTAGQPILLVEMVVGRLDAGNSYWKWTGDLYLENKSDFQKSEAPIENENVNVGVGGSWGSNWLFPVATTPVVHQRLYQKCALFKRKHPIVCTVGLIGVGKTELAKQLAESIEVPYYAEKVAENTLLDMFYEDMAKYSFELQIHLIRERARQMQIILREGKGGCVDKSIYEEWVFINALNEAGLLDDFHAKEALASASYSFESITPPDLIIWLDAKPEICLQRIKTRGREMEKNITLEYLKLQRKWYKRLMTEVAKVVPVIRIPWNEFRPVEEAIVQIKNILDGQQRIQTLSFANNEPQEGNRTARIQESKDELILNHIKKLRSDPDYSKGPIIFVPEEDLLRLPLTTPKPRELEELYAYAEADWASDGFNTDAGCYESTRDVDLATSSATSKTGTLCPECARFPSSERERWICTHLGVPTVNGEPLEQYYGVAFQPQADRDRK